MHLLFYSAKGRLFGPAGNRQPPVGTLILRRLRAIGVIVMERGNLYPL